MQDCTPNYWLNCKIMIGIMLGLKCDFIFINKFSSTFIIKDIIFRFQIASKFIVKSFLYYHFHKFRQQQLSSNKSINYFKCILLQPWHLKQHTKLFSMEIFIAHRNKLFSTWIKFNSPFACCAIVSICCGTSNVLPFYFLSNHQVDKQ